MYRIIVKEIDEKIFTTIKKIGDNSSTYIPLSLENSDFIEFKRQIVEDESQLQDADGNVMTAEEAKAYIATLPA